MIYKNLFSLEGRVAVVTGGYGLIGQEIVNCLNEFGSTVYVADIGEERGKETDSRSGINFISCDVTSKESVKNLVDKIVKDQGSIDILVHSAYPRTKDWGNKFENISSESWKENCDNQLGSCFFTCQNVAEQMKKQNGGSIINIGSTYGVVGPDFSIYEGTEMTMPAAYSAIKGGVINFTRYLATYYGKYNIRVNAISPGGILDGQPKPFVEKYSNKTPLGRMGAPQEIASAAIYLASDASSYVTGHNLMVDGGWTAC